MVLLILKKISEEPSETLRLMWVSGLTSGLASGLASGGVSDIVGSVAGLQYVDGEPCLVVWCRPVFRCDEIC